MNSSMKENIIQEKSYYFAIQIVKLAQQLVAKDKEFVLSRQVLRSGTSIGANVEEAQGAQSKRDFVAKMTIAYKEARETLYWIRLLKDSGYLNEKLSVYFLNAINEILSIIVTILKTSKKEDRDNS
ncbi:MAG: hypothetical protein G01um101418_628 [Parcubacteria group bacterium Gr01-1014_18]|nr:MAG: hypothetical protein Greene041636_661 [Parcubacteria group bacterium Greene0416_36]TSC80709.1 MAG: hypothetical protein G01um101418_628 [Parcubacteria group bacterium Gr01-1014_18]TSC98680.1 MAG: hypothetical protein Greene101420_639 [Parcubacteria group bacterium Greene1014_20]TSD07160.1 MAG: hypothetical protein Greene07142_329 [Parcubacteria group bacterium Greene0714_2]